MQTEAVEPYDLTPNTAADLLGVTRPVVVAYAKSGRLPCLVTPGGHRRFRRSDVLALAEGQPASDGAA